ncbi:MAG: two pore domain potassium channel family protein [Firmicutes bacterium]|nr:two pore domain potassium channel family protein [Bacillota bacterium]
MKTLKRIRFVLKMTHADRLFWSFLLLLAFCSVLITLIEPDIHSVWDGFWYLYVAATTIGFGDIYAVTMLGRILTILVSMMGILVVAMVPGVVVSYYTEFVRSHQEESVSLFVEKLENLPDLSPEELAELSEKVRKLREKKI